MTNLSWNRIGIYTIFSWLLAYTLITIELETYSQSCQTSIMECFAKIVNENNSFCKMVLLRCLRKFRIHLWQLPKSTKWIIHLVRMQNFPKKLTFLTLSYAHVRVRISGYKMLVFLKILRTYQMNGPKNGSKTNNDSHISS